MLQELQGSFWYQNSWQHTYLAQAFTGTPLPEDRLRVPDMYSDVLYQPWRCATAPLRKTWLSTHNIPRESGLSAEAFRARFEAANRPVIIADGVSVLAGWQPACQLTSRNGQRSADDRPVLQAADWPAVQKWSQDHLQACYGSRATVVGDMDMPLANYLQYLQHSADEMPLYLFDKAFTRAAPGLEPDFQASTPCPHLRARCFVATAPS